MLTAPQQQDTHDFGLLLNLQTPINVLEMETDLYNWQHNKLCKARQVLLITFWVAEKETLLYYTVLFKSSRAHMFLKYLTKYRKVHTTVHPTTQQLWRQTTVLSTPQGVAESWSNFPRNFVHKTFKIRRHSVPALQIWLTLTEHVFSSLQIWSKPN